MGNALISHIVVSVFLSVCMAIFSIINIHNIIGGTRERRVGKAYAEVEPPHGLLFSMAAFSTLFFFILSALYVILSLCSMMDNPILTSIQLPNSEFIQGMGITLMAIGYKLFISSVIVRGRYSVSWEMTEDHKLIVTGPYRYIRHPSYMGYFLMFSGLSLIWLNLLSFLPLIGIAGYVRVTDIEEQLLMKRFGTEYEVYRKKTGRFIPKAFKGRT